MCFQHQRTVQRIIGDSTLWIGIVRHFKDMMLNHTMFFEAVAKYFPVLDARVAGTRFCIVFRGNSVCPLYESVGRHHPIKSPLECRSEGQDGARVTLLEQFSTEEQSIIARADTWNEVPYRLSPGKHDVRGEQHQSPESVGAWRPPDSNH